MTNPSDLNAAADATIATLTSNLTALRNALVTGSAMADTTESARSAAETAYVGSVADALVAGTSAPTPSPTLVALRAADDAADGALQVISQRIPASEGALRMAVYVEGQRRMAVEYAAAATAAATAIDNIMAGLAELVDAVGVRTFQDLSPLIASTFAGFRNRASTHDQTMTALRGFLLTQRSGVVVGAQLVDGMHGDQAVANGWPTRDGIAAAAKAAVAS